MIRVRVLLAYLSLSSGVLACDPASDPSRISSVGGSITEILYLLGMQANVISVDTTSNFPAIAKEKPSVGYVRNISAEGVLSLKPTVIIGENDMGPKEVVTQLRKTGVELQVVKEEHSLGGVIRKLRCVASIVGRRSIADEILENDLNAKVLELKQLVRSNAARPLRVMFILSLQGGSPIVGGRGVSADGLISMAGGVNSVSFEGWKPVGPEAIIAAEPDVIIVTERGLKGYGTKEELLKHPSIRFTDAVVKDQILVMDGMATLGFGPRAVSSALRIAKQLSEFE